MRKAMPFVRNHSYKLFLGSIVLAVVVWELVFELASPHAARLLRLGVLFIAVAVLTAVWAWKFTPHRH